MKISVKVKPGSKKNAVESIGENEYTISVKAKAIEGKANDAVVELLSEYFDLPRNRIMVIKGLKSKNKVIEKIVYLEKGSSSSSGLDSSNNGNDNVVHNINVDIWQKDNRIKDSKDSGYR